LSAATAGSDIDDEALAPDVEEPVLAAATAPVAVAVGTPAVDDVPDVPAAASAYNATSAPAPASAGDEPTVVFADATQPAAAEAKERTGIQELSLTARAKHPFAPLRAYVTLCMRMIAVIFSDRGYTAFLLGLPLALALLSRAVPGDMGLSPDPAGWSLEAQRLLVVFVIGAAFMGVAVAIREIVNEQSIYRRERAVGLSPTAYLLSKVTVFIVIDAIQCTAFIYLSMWGRPKPAEALFLPSPMAEITIAATLVAVASTAIGLLASALVRTTEQTTPILVVSVMAQLVLSGGLFAIEGEKVLEIISVVDPARWGFAAGAATTNLVKFPFPDPLWDHVQFNWFRAVGIMLLQVVILLVATRFALRRFEPGRR
ncbi:MAG: ABC transporter permease, partial [Hamadaea sp.]|nr:ABC transporter permease [Hamadaea sp.]